MIQAATIAYPVSLAALIAFLLAMRDSFDLRTAVALFLNWVAGLVVLAVTPVEQAWAPFIVVDALTAYVILRQPAHMQQAIVGGLLLSQIVWHAAFGWVGTSYSLHFYLTAVNLAGWLMVATLFGGAAYDGGRKVLLDWRGASGAGAPSAHGDRGVAKWRGP
jgi:hypothetical protein